MDTSKGPKANMAIVDDSIDDVHKLHVTIRDSKKYRPLKGYKLNIKKTDTKLSIKEIVKYSAITRGALGEVEESIFNSFLEAIRNDKPLTKEAKKKVAEFDAKFDLLITNQ